MDDNNLTERETWREYWSNHKLESVPANPFYKRYLPEIPATAKFIEIGGFPGYNAGFFHKNVCRDVSILDFHIDTEIVRKLEQANGMQAGTIKTVEADFFASKPVSEETFGVVFSIGFVEHFQDTEDVVARHVELLEKDGWLVMILPNFRGLNGWLQYLFDRKNLAMHNLDSMRLDRLRACCECLDLKDVKVEYTRRPMLWLEPKDTVLNRIGRFLVKGLSYFLKLFPFKGRLLSPYMIVVARK